MCSRSHQKCLDLWSSDLSFKVILAIQFLHRVYKRQQSSENPSRHNSLLSQSLVFPPPPVPSFSTMSSSPISLGCLHEMWRLLRLLYLANLCHVSPLLCHRSPRMPPNHLAHQPPSLLRKALGFHVTPPDGWRQGGKIEIVTSKLSH
jgi:hypothetical protein